jgi:CPA1 family monovalent cation:H+ antiporter
MAVFELVMSLLLAGAVLSAWARRVKAPYPALLALAGAALALIPDAPRVALDPQLALALFVAPVLLDAAFDSSPRDLKENWRPLVSLALVAVALTVVAVAVVARWVVPDLPWASAIALGAIVAPPDAAAASAVLKQLRPPHRLLVILEGESLFNDASALLIYRLAVAATLTGGFSLAKAAPMLALVSLGSVALGAVLSRVVVTVNQRVEDVPTAVILQFLSTFSVWILAERLHLSGIITMVVFATLVARTTPLRTPARLRIPSYAVWEVTVFVLNVLAFILVGLQLKPILEHLGAAQRVRYLVAAAAVCGAVILVRIAWVMSYTIVAQWVRGWLGHRLERPPAHSSLRSGAVVAWCGMRGIVTLAAALALPAGFPYRDLLVLASFSVVLVTLVLQGLTLNPFMRLLSLAGDDTVAREIRLARVEIARAALAAMRDGDTDGGAAELVRRKLEARLQRAERAASDPEGPDSRAVETEALRRAQSAERHTLFDLRARGVIGDDAFHRVEEELDWAELNTEGMARRS